MRKRGPAHRCARPQVLQGCRGYGWRISISAKFHRSVATPVTPRLVGTPASGTGFVERSVQKVSVIALVDVLTIVDPAAGDRARKLSQSLPTPNTHELARVVVSVAEGLPATPAALLAIAVAAPTSEFAAPWKPTTVIEAISDRLSTPVTVMDARAVGANAHQISDVPSCVLTRLALVQVSGTPLLLLFTPLTITLGPVAGPSVEMNATSNVAPATAKGGLVMVVFGDVALRETNVAIVGAVPCEMTSATALPPGALAPAAGVWLITDPAATVVLGEKVIAPTVRPALVSVVLAAACV